MLGQALNEYRKLSNEQMRARLGARNVLEIRGKSGTGYQVEIEVIWDNKPNGNIRVLGAIDDGRLRAYSPLTRSFILAPDGSFVGE